MRHMDPPSSALFPAAAGLAGTERAAGARRSIARAGWIKSPAWDLVWVLNTLWLIPLVLLLAWGHDDARTSPVDALFFVLAVPLWFGHRVSSAWLAYATPAYRAVVTTQRMRFIVVPLIICAVCFAALLAPESVLPMPLTERSRSQLAIVVSAGAA